jgi:ring-1,2-phenylacetyl-CoA epoxidase subunit PaaB
MTAGDTQWPRYHVFHQEGLDQPHINSGSVHATDAEMALQNARDVFARRPECVSLWVVPAADIHSLTADELERMGVPEPGTENGTAETYQVFLKQTQIGSHGHVGSVQAASPADALALAISEYGKQGGLVWWVVPDASIARTPPDEIDSLFQPAASKHYRSQSFYHTVTLMRRIREKKELSE